MKRAAFGQAIARLQQGASAAVTTLLKMMIDASTPASVRVRAAECVINHVNKAIEIEDIEARRAALMMFIRIFWTKNGRSAYMHISTSGESSPAASRMG